MFLIPPSPKENENIDEASREKMRQDSFKKKTGSCNQNPVEFSAVAVCREAANKADVFVVLFYTV